MKIHLIQAALDMRRFNYWAGNRGLVRTGSFDAGYAFHVLLSGMFGKGALQPFRLFASERRASAVLYAYASVDETELREIAAAVAPPDSIDVIDPDRMRSKCMPTQIEQGRRLGFDLRLRPVRRLDHELADPQSGRSLPKGAEVDAFRLEMVRRFPTDGPIPAAAKAGVTRESVYAEWLGERFGNAVAVEECRLVSVSRSRAARGNKGSPEGPDAILQGTFRVADEGAFAAVLRNGIGRHRAYGYGMLLLRPPDRTVPER